MLKPNVSSLYMLSELEIESPSWKSVELSAVCWLPGTTNLLFPVASNNLIRGCGFQVVTFPSYERDSVLEYIKSYVIDIATSR